MALKINHSGYALVSYLLVSLCFCLCSHLTAVTTSELMPLTIPGDVLVACRLAAVAFLKTKSLEECDAKIRDCDVQIKFSDDKVSVIFITPRVPGVLEAKSKEEAEANLRKMSKQVVTLVVVDRLKMTIDKIVPQI